MRDLVAQGGTLTLGKINKVLADAGVHWSLPEARAAANDELDTLLRRVA